MITNPIDRLPLALEAIRDYLSAFISKYLILMIITLVLMGLVAFGFASTRDFIISCDTYSIESGISCPIK